MGALINLGGGVTPTGKAKKPTRGQSQVAVPETGGSPFGKIFSRGPKPPKALPGNKEDLQVNYGRREMFGTGALALAAAAASQKAEAATMPKTDSKTYGPMVMNWLR